MVRDHGADELRLGTDRDPRILKGGSPVRTSIPTTNDDFLRILLEPMFTPALEAQLRAEGRVETTHQAAGDGGYVVSLTRRGNPGPTDPMPFDVVFRKGAAAAPPPVPVAAPPRAAVIVVPPAPAVARPTPAPAVVASGDVLSLLRRAALTNASDLHLCTGEIPSLRIDGSLRLIDGPPARVEALFESLLDEDAIEQLDGGRSIDRLVDAGADGRFRVNLYRVAGKLAAAVRVLPRGAPTVADLNLPPGIEDCVALPHGLVLVCGPTGSGKSATLAALAGAALANAAARGQGKLLITLEEPVEYIIAPRATGIVRQRQIGRDVRDFPGGLRDALREDPDILLIGEMRDPETIGLAMTAAETGHLVLSSVHSRSAASTVERIVDSYPPGRQTQIRVQLADALRAVISQRLVPAMRGGRVPAVEILRGTSSVGSLIREGKTAQLTTAIQSGRKDGMVPLERSLADLVRAQQITREEAHHAANDIPTLMQFLG
ncbi:MAG: PilT/PilU family type 4a pilus ATPase [Polyangia bacterium]